MFTKRLALALLSAAAVTVPVAQAQINETALAGLSDTLAAAGVKKFLTYFERFNNTPTGQNLLALLSDGKQNLTFFAPNDNSFLGLLPNISQSDQLLADTFAYHVVSSELSPGNVSNVTIGRTYLNDPHLVALEGGKSQALAWSKLNDGKVHVINQNTAVFILNTTRYNNIAINVINAVIDVPGYFPGVAAVHKLTAIPRVMEDLPYMAYPPDGRTPINTTYLDAFSAGGWDGVTGYTFFVPDDVAFEAATSQLAGIAGNVSTLVTVLQNHIINGTTVYSPTLYNGSPSYISSAGETLSLSTNASGSFVTSGSSTAKILRSDIIANNGVLHVIDSVLANTASNSAAASSAYASATSIAAQTGTASGTPSPTAKAKSAAAASMVRHWYLLAGFVGGALPVVL